MQASATCNVGYIKIEDFGGYDDYVEAFNLALTDLKTFATKALVIDLVDNGGGSLDYGLKLAELLKASNTTDPKLEVRLNDNGSVKISVSDRIGDGNLLEDQKREVWFEHCKV